MPRVSSHCAVLNNSLFALLCDLSKNEKNWLLLSQLIKFVNCNQIWMIKLVFRMGMVSAILRSYHNEYQLGQMAPDQDVPEEIGTVVFISGHCSPRCYTLAETVECKQRYHDRNKDNIIRKRRLSYGAKREYCGWPTLFPID